jgi:CRISPR/Cas system-associated exonuclease Cas4 (RecB family)
MAEIKLSASSLKDYLECPRRFWYRVNRASEAETNDDMLFGSLVHSAIERYSNKDEATAFFWRKWKEIKDNSFLPDDIKKTPKSVNKIMDGYYDKILPKLSSNPDVVKELFFKAPFDNIGKDKIVLIGKIDRIDSGMIYDWKTSYNRPTEYTIQDIQFYMYDLAYNILNNTPPIGIFYGHLYTGTLYPVELKDSLRENLRELILKVADEIRSVDRYPAITGYQCNRCLFKNICFRELDKNELGGQPVH